MKSIGKLGTFDRYLPAAADDPKAVKFHFEIDLPSKFWLPIDPLTENQQDFEPTGT